MALQLGQVIEGIGPAELAGVNEAHEDVAHVGAVARLVEQGVLAVQDGLLQSTFADVVVQRSPGLAQEECQLLVSFRQACMNRREAFGIVGCRRKAAWRTADENRNDA